MSKRINIIKYQLKNRLKHNLSNLMAMPPRGSGLFLYFYSSPHLGRPRRLGLGRSGLCSMCATKVYIN